MNRRGLGEIHITMALLVLAFAALAAWSVSTFQEVMREDGLVEWGTSLAYLAATALALVGFVRAIRPRGPGAGRSPATRDVRAAVIYLGLAAFCLFVGGEEVSWGQRVFGFTPPELFLERNYQQETELHNLVAGGAVIAYGPSLVAIAYGVLLPLLGRLLKGGAPVVASWVEAAAPPVALAPWFILVPVFETWYPLPLIGEATELGLGALFLMDIILKLGRTVRRPTRLLPPTPFAAAGVVIALTIATPMTVDAIHSANPGRDVAQATLELDQLGDDLADRPVLQAPLLSTSAVHQRMFTVVGEGLVRFGTTSVFLGHRLNPAEDPSMASRHDRVGFFLDPWNTPYWFYYDRDAAAILVYSMGPNRKRDTAMTNLSVERLRAGDLDGDDIGVVVHLRQKKAGT